MALKGQPISLGTSDTTVYTCPASTEASIHGLIISNNTGSAATFTLKVYIQSTATTTTVATGISVAANSTYTWPKPIDVNAGDIIKVAASALSTLVALYSVYEGSNPPVAVGFTPRGTWSSVANYVTNDVVTRSNNSYLALQASTNQDPATATSYWMQLFTSTGDVTGAASSTDNAIARFDGTTGRVIQNSAVTIADTTGDITGGTYNKVTITAPATGSTLTIANGKTLTANNTLTFTGTDSSSVAFGTGGTVAYTGGTLAQFSSTTSSQLAGVISDETGSGSLVFATSPSLTTPTLGVASATSLNKVTVTAPATGATLTLGDGSTLTLAASSSLTTSGAHATTLTTSGTTALTLPTSGTVTALGNTTTGSGSIVLATSPSLTTPTLGVASATTVNKVTLTAPATGSTLTLGDGSTLSLAASKTFTVSNTLTFTGTDSSSVAFGAGGTAAFIGTQQAYSKQQYFSVATLTDAASIAWDVSVAQKAKVTLGGNRTLAAVTNPVEGATYYLYVFQNGTGGYTLSYTTTASTTGTVDFGGATTPVITTTASKGDVLAFEGVNIGGYVRLRYLGIMQGFAA